MVAATVQVVGQAEAETRSVLAAVPGPLGAVFRVATSLADRGKFPPTAWRSLRTAIAADHGLDTLGHLARFARVVAKHAEQAGAPCNVEAVERLGTLGVYKGLSGLTRAERDEAEHLCADVLAPVLTSPLAGDLRAAVERADAALRGA